MTQYRFAGGTAPLGLAIAALVFGLYLLLICADPAELRCRTSRLAARSGLIRSFWTQMFRDSNACESPVVGAMMMIIMIVMAMKMAVVVVAGVSHRGYSGDDGSDAGDVCGVDVRLRGE
jgi:hypothetical protein